MRCPMCLFLLARLRSSPPPRRPRFLVAGIRERNATLAHAACKTALDDALAPLHKRVAERKFESVEECVICFVSLSSFFRACVCVCLLVCSSAYTTQVCCQRAHGPRPLPPLGNRNGGARHGAAGPRARAARCCRCRRVVRPRCATAVSRATRGVSSTRQAPAECGAQRSDCCAGRCTRG